MLSTILFDKSFYAFEGYDSLGEYTIDISLVHMKMYIH